MAAPIVLWPLSVGRLLGLLALLIAVAMLIRGAAVVVATIAPLLFLRLLPEGLSLLLLGALGRGC